MVRDREIKLSKYYHALKVDEYYAVFNSLLLDVCYVSESELREIESLSVSDSVVDVFLKKGIYVRDTLSDEKAIETIRKSYTATVGDVRMLYLIMTDSCNLSCDYCLINKNPNNIHLHRTMSDITARNAIAQFAHFLNGNGVGAGEIVFFGGEPLIRFEVIKMCIEYAESFPVDFKFSVVSNGTLLNEEIVSFFSQHNVNVGLSIDGPKGINDIHRVYLEGNDSVYDKVMANAELLRRFHCQYGFSLTLTDEVLANSSNIVEWLIDQKMDVFFNLFHFGADDDWTSKSEDAADFLIATYDKLEACGVVSERVERQVKGFLSDDFVFSDCGAKGCRQITVKTNGDICICHADASTNNGVLGNIDVDSIESIRNKIQKDFYGVSGIPIFEESCLNCPAIRMCGGGCVQIAQEISHGARFIDDSFCKYVLKTFDWLLRKYKNTVKEVN